MFVHSSRGLAREVTLPMELSLSCRVIGSRHLGRKKSYNGLLVRSGSRAHLVKTPNVCHTPHSDEDFLPDMQELNKAEARAIDGWRYENFVSARSK